MLLIALICMAAIASALRPSPRQLTMSSPVEVYQENKKVISKRYSWELDTNAMLEKSTFAIKPHALVDRCKDVVDNGIGLKRADDLAENFQFIFPVVGPLSKAEYLEAVGGFNLATAFPGFDQGLYSNFHVDAYEHNRVWFTAQFIAFHGGDGPFGKVNASAGSDGLGS